MLTDGMHDDLNLIQHSSFTEETYMLGRSSVQMTVNDSFECSDIHLVTSVSVPLCQLQVSFSINQSFDPLLYFSLWGKCGGRPPGLSHGNVLLGRSDWVRWSGTHSSLAVALG